MSDKRPMSLSRVVDHIMDTNYESKIKLAFQPDPNEKDRARVALMMGWKVHEGDAGPIGLYEYWESPEGETQGMTTFYGPKFNPFKKVKDDYDVLVWAVDEFGQPYIDEVNKLVIEPAEYTVGDYVKALIILIDK